MVAGFAKGPAARVTRYGHGSGGVLPRKMEYDFGMGSTCDSSGTLKCVHRHEVQRPGESLDDVEPGN